MPRSYMITGLIYKAELRTPEHLEPKIKLTMKQKLMIGYSIFFVAWLLHGLFIR
jgi:hypothetical protein